MRKTIFGSLSAGLMISIGGAVFLACENKVVGAVFFSIALLTICKLGLYLFTGKIGLVGEHFEPKDALHLAVGLVGNYVSATAFGRVLAYALPASAEKAAALCEKKLGQNPLQTFILGVFCGVLMYVAVKVFADKSLIGILYGIPVFILAGFEHSIADMFYFSIGGSFTGRSVLFLAMVVLGNAVSCATMGIEKSSNMISMRCFIYRCPPIFIALLFVNVVKIGIYNLNPYVKP